VVGRKRELRRAPGSRNETVISGKRLRAVAPGVIEIARSWTESLAAIGMENAGQGRRFSGQVIAGQFEGVVAAKIRVSETGRSSDGLQYALAVRVLGIFTCCRSVILKERRIAVGIKHQVVIGDDGRIQTKRKCQLKGPASVRTDRIGATQDRGTRRQNRPSDSHTEELVTVHAARRDHPVA